MWNFQVGMCHLILKPHKLPASKEEKKKSPTTRDKPVISGLLWWLLPFREGAEGNRFLYSKLVILICKKDSQRAAKQLWNCGISSTLVFVLCYDLWFTQKFHHCRNWLSLGSLAQEFSLSFEIFCHLVPEAHSLRRFS